MLSVSYLPTLKEDSVGSMFRYSLLYKTFQL